MEKCINLPNEIFNLHNFSGRQSSTNDAHIEFGIFHRCMTRLRVNDFIGEVAYSRLQQMYTCETPKV